MNFSRVLDTESAFENSSQSVIEFLSDRDSYDGKDDGVFIKPTEVTQFFSLEQCDRFFVHHVAKNGPPEGYDINDFKEAFIGLSPAFDYDGDFFEDVISESVTEYAFDHIVCNYAPLYNTYSHLLPDSYSDLDDGVSLEQEFFDYMKWQFLSEDDDVPFWIQRLPMRHAINEHHDTDIDSPIIFEQFPLAGRIGSWPIGGVSDLIFVWFTDERELEFRVCEVKASNEEKPHHRLQVGIYIQLLEKFLNDWGLDDAGFEWEISGGVITKETEIAGCQPEYLPEFDLEPVESDINRVFDFGGYFEQLADKYKDIDSLQEVDYQLNSKCLRCDFKESCYTSTLQTSDVSLLGIDSSLQSRLENHGIETLYDVASLFENESDEMKPTSYDSLTPSSELTANDIQTLKSLMNDHKFGSEFMEYVQKSQSYLSEIDPENDYATDANISWIQGSGKPPLPDDEPPEMYNVLFDRGSLIRIYFFTQLDSRFDRLPVISAHITATNSDESIVVSEVCDIPHYDIDSAKEKYENELEDYTESENVLLESFTEKLFDGINEIADSIDTTQNYLHTYFYSQSDVSSLIDALRRHDEPDSRIRALRDILTLDGDIARNEYDQDMVSIIEPIIENHIATPTPNTGLTNVWRYFSMDNFDGMWNYKASDNDVYNLQDVFNHKFFYPVRPFKYTDDGIELQKESVDVTKDSYTMYPSLMRNGSEIPIEYIWVACGKVTPDNVDEWKNLDVKEDANMQDSIVNYLYRDGDTWIDKHDLKVLVEKLSETIGQIERSITYRDIEMMQEKEIFDVSTLDGFEIDSSISDAALDVLFMEYGSGRKESKEEFKNRPWQRVKNGESIIVKVEDVIWTENYGELLVRASMPYNEIDALSGNEELIKRNNRLKDSDTNGSGSWLVLNRLDNETLNEYRLSVDSNRNPQSPDEIERGVQATLHEYNTNPDDLEDEVVFTVQNQYWEGGDLFEIPHRSWIADEIDAISNEHKTYIGEGEYYILDKRTDDLTAERTIGVLEMEQSNELIQLVDDMVSGDVKEPTTNIFDESFVDEYISFLHTDDVSDIPPNKKQQKFIKDIESQISILQGPPGTGKTGGSLSAGVLARHYSIAKGGDVGISLATGPSNKAVDEMAEAFAERYCEYSSQMYDYDCIDNSLENALVIRVTGDLPDENERVDGLVYYNYHLNEAVCGDGVDYDGYEIVNMLESTLNERLVLENNQSKLSGNNIQLVVCATPSRTKRLMEEVAPLGDEEDVEMYADISSGVFDFVTIDEGSMLRLPELFIPGAFMKPNSQLLIGGDNRQMSPVQKHEWENEYRRSIEEYVPYLSTLDYFRLLNGGDFDHLEHEHKVCTDVEIGYYGLDYTFRCHPIVADFLNENVYKQDGINYRSKVNTNSLINQPSDSISTPTEEILAPEKPLVVVVHDDNNSWQTNKDEQQIVDALIEGMNTDESTGVVTPHNAQRGLIQSSLSGISEWGDNEIPDVNTVERYQGGERDSIFVSTTVSSENALEAEDEFILNPNRINVAMSRMKKKLVIIVGERLFDLIPDNIDTYEDAAIWKKLWDDVCDEPDWSGSVSDIDDDVDSDTNINIYSSKIN